MVMLCSYNHPRWIRNLENLEKHPRCNLLIFRYIILDSFLTNCYLNVHYQYLWDRRKNDSGRFTNTFTFSDSILIPINLRLGKEKGIMGSKKWEINEKYVGVQILSSTEPIETIFELNMKATLDINNTN